MGRVVSVAGGDLVASAVAEAALAAGGHLHLGLEFFGGDRSPSNVELVREAVALCRSLGHRPATPDEPPPSSTSPRWWDERRTATPSRVAATTS